MLLPSGRASGALIAIAAAGSQARALLTKARPSRVRSRHRHKHANAPADAPAMRRPALRSLPRPSGAARTRCCRSARGRAHTWARAAAAAAAAAAAPCRRAHQRRRRVSQRRPSRRRSARPRGSSRCPPWIVCDPRGLARLGLEPSAELF